MINSLKKENINHLHIRWICINVIRKDSIDVCSDCDFISSNGFSTVIFISNYEEKESTPVWN